MSVNWLWKNKVGEMVYQRKADGKTIKVKENIYLANCLACVIYETKKEYTFKGFWNDKQHLKRCLGLAKGCEDIYSELNSDWKLSEVLITRLTKETKTIAECFATAGYKVVIKIKKEEE